LHADQAAAEEGLIGDALDRLGAGIAFLGRALRRRGHPWPALRHEGDLQSVIVYYNRHGGVTQAVFECEFALGP
jgi:hypothetical protein